MIEVKIWDIIKLKDYASSPRYTYLVLWIDIEVTFWWKQIETSFISKNSIEKILFNIWIW